MMKQKKVKFASADEAKEFVSIASGCDFDVNVFYNRMAGCFFYANNEPKSARERLWRLAR